eukprot:357392-Chlamydomonas_euryale.AAC.11
MLFHGAGGQHPHRSATSASRGALGPCPQPAWDDHDFQTQGLKITHVRPTSGPASARGAAPAHCVQPPPPRLRRRLCPTSLRHARSACVLQAAPGARRRLAGKAQPAPAAVVVVKSAPVPILTTRPHGACGARQPA